jgi:hypothetical protein
VMLAVVAIASCGVRSATAGSVAPLLLRSINATTPRRCWTGAGVAARDGRSSSSRRRRPTAGSAATISGRFMASFSYATGFALATATAAAAVLGGCRRRGARGC